MREIRIEECPGWVQRVRDYFKTTDFKGFQNREYKVLLMGGFCFPFSHILRHILSYGLSFFAQYYGFERLKHKCEL